MQISTPRSNLIVRFLAVFLLCYSSLYAGTDQTGKQKITVVASDVTLGTVFKQIEKQTGLRFMYAVDAVNVEEKVTVAFEKVMLDDVLGNLLARKGIEWGYREGVISLKKNGIEDPNSKSLNSDPPMTISGKILDAKGNPVPGATVMVKGGKKGTTTDSDGGFMLAGIEINTVLLIRSMGFGTKEIVVNGKTLIIRMNEVVNILDETIIKGGYYNTTQRFNTGSVGIVKAEDISKQPVSDPLLALQGRVPGLMIEQTRGINGGQIKVQLRGVNSIRSGTQPLFIIDGIPYSSSVSTFGSFGAMGNNISALNFINPADIESVEVLKDADATSIYGSRGANGVILINTKRGKAGVPKVNINFYKGWAQIAKKRKLLDTKQYLAMRREAFYNDSINNPWSNIQPTALNAPDLTVWDQNSYTDWQDAMVGGTAAYADVQASVSGGTSNVQYLIGGNYHKETTVFPGDFYSQRGGAHFNISGSSSDQRLKTTLTGSYSVSGNNFPGVDFATHIYQPPNTPSPYNSDGSLNWANSTWVNPYAELINKVAEPKINNLLANIDVSYRILPDFIIKANIGGSDGRTNTFNGFTIAGVKPSNRAQALASALHSNSSAKSWIFEPQAIYSTNLANGKLNALVGATLLGNKNNQEYIYVSGIKDDGLIRYMGAATGFSVTNEGLRYKYASLYSRIGYILDEKYVMNITVRRDGSSRFGDRKKFAYFGSVGLAWVFSQEKLIAVKMPFLNYGKVRISYGTTGNDQIGDYKYVDRYEFQNQVYQGVKGLQVTDLFNRDFSWELTKKFEAGLETSFLNERLAFNASYYLNRSSNQLLPYPLASITGVSLITGNLPAVIQNRGLELSIATQNIKNKFFKWSSSFNISFSNNKYVSYTGHGDPYATVGQSLGTRDLYAKAGIDPTNGTYLFLNAEGKPDASSEASFNASSVDIYPTYFGGFQNTVSFKGFQLDIFFQYVRKKAYSGILDIDSNRDPGKMRNQPLEVLDRWTSKGGRGRFQRYSQNSDLKGAFITWTNSNDAYVDASFIRCKNIAISWSMSEIWKKRMHVNDCRIYLQGQNVFTITKYPGWDPETASAVVIPPLRVITAGIQLVL